MVAPAELAGAAAPFIKSDRNCIIADMSAIDPAEVKRLASLARIGVSDEAAAALATELASIVGFVGQLGSVETTGVEPTSQVTGLVDVWRDDVARPSVLSREALLAGAPQTQDGYIKVKRVL